MDNNEILSCTVYHGKSREDVDTATARGKYLVQMLFGFMENPNNKFLPRAAMEITDSLEERARIHIAQYYVSLQFKQEVSCSYPQMTDQWTTYTCTSSFDSAVINVGANTITLSTDSGYEIFSCQDSEMTADFSGRCKEWEEIEDWDAAFARLEEEQAQQRTGYSEPHMPAADAEQDGQFSFLGMNQSHIQACSIYHGESQQELDLSSGKGQEFIGRLSAFLLEKGYSDGPNGDLELTLSENPDLGAVARENGEDYYILLQFTQPWTFVLNGKPEGTVQFRDCDKLLIEVSKEDKALRLLWHHPDMTGADLFFGNMGVYSKKIYKNYLQAVNPAI